MVVEEQMLCVLDFVGEGKKVSSIVSCSKGTVPADLISAYSINDKTNKIIYSMRKNNSK